MPKTPATVNTYFVFSGLGNRVNGADSPVKANAPVKGAATNLERDLPTIPPQAD